DIGIKCLARNLLWLSGRNAGVCISQAFYLLTRPLTPLPTVRAGPFDKLRANGNSMLKGRVNKNTARTTGGDHSARVAGAQCAAVLMHRIDQHGYGLGRGELGNAVAQVEHMAGMGAVGV